LNAIREHLGAPGWKTEMRELLETMVAEEFGDNAQGRVDERKRQLEWVNRQIARIIEAIKTSGRFSEAMNGALADLETQRESVRRTLTDAEARANKRIGADALAQQIMAYFGDFDRLWRKGLTLEEQKELLRCYVHQINISHSPTSVEAEIWLYKIRSPQRK